MNFNADGYLEAGFHDLTVDQIEKHFVEDFSLSSTRGPIFEGYLRHRADVVSLGLSCEQFIDGSFASIKNDPGDIDLIAWFPVDMLDALGPNEQKVFLALFSGPLTKETHKCDAYFCPAVPPGHPRYNELRLSRKYWLGEFGYDRHEKPKGIVRTVVTPPRPAAP